MIISDAENEKDDPYEMFSSPKKYLKSAAKGYGRMMKLASQKPQCESEKK